MPKICISQGCKYFQFGGKYCLNHQYKRTDKKKKIKDIVFSFYDPRPVVINLPAKARQVFNKWVRWRDRFKGCISCDTGRVEEAGHYYPSGKYPKLRYNEINTNGQCHECNCHNEGNLVPYRNGLIKRYGLKKVKELDKLATKEPFTWSDDQLRAIINKYKCLS